MYCRCHESIEGPGLRSCIYFKSCLLCLLLLCSFLVSAALTPHPLFFNFQLVPAGSFCRSRLAPFPSIARDLHDVLGSRPPSTDEAGKAEAKTLLPLQLPMLLWGKSWEIILFIF